MAQGGIVLTHGAGSNRDAPLLQALEIEFIKLGLLVVRVNLAFRETRPHGSPFPAGAAMDREGLARDLQEMRAQVSGKVFVGGHSYGGRQATMLAAEHPDVTDGLLLLSYPLHPPRQPARLRTDHFPNLRTLAMFVHGTRDPFGSLDEMKNALGLIPARTRLLEIDGAGHDLKKASPALIASDFMATAGGV